MSSNLQRHHAILKLIAEINPKYRKAVLLHADKKLIDAVSEAAENVLKARVPLDPKSKRRLSFHKRALRALAKRGSLKSKRKLLVQKGGALFSILAPLVASALGTLISSNV